MCCDDMKSIFTFAVLLFTFGVCIHFAESKRHKPQPDEIERVINETHSILWKCTEKRRCDPGYGLSVQCGSSVSINVSIKCVPCVKGESYSDVKDHSVCKRCAQCGEHQERTGQCTLTADNIQCLEQCNKGYYWDKVTDDCHACSLCCNSSKEDAEQHCIDSGLPPQQQCRETHQTCPPPSSPFTTEENKEERGMLSAAKNNLKPTKPANTSSLSLNVGLGVGLPLTALIILYIFFKFFCSCCNSCPLGTSTTINKVYFNCPQNDVEASLLDDSMTLAGNSIGKVDIEEAPNTTVCIKSKFCRLLSCPESKESDRKRPKFCKAQSYPGCLPELNGSHQEKEGFDVDKFSAQNKNVIRRSEQDIFQDQSQDLDEPDKATRPLTCKREASYDMRISQVPYEPLIHQICMMLEPRRDFDGKDYRMLASELGLTNVEIDYLETRDNKTYSLLMQTFAAKENSGTLNDLVQILKRIGRHDVVEVIDKWVNGSF